MNSNLLTKDKIITWSLTIAGAIVAANISVTGSKILFTPFLLLGLLGWIRFSRRFPAVSLMIIIFFAEDCFDIYTFGFRQRLLSDIGIGLMLPIILLNVRKVWHHIVRDHSPYAIAILLFLFAIVISLYFGSALTFGQPMTVGLTVARKYLLFLSYFFMVAVGANRKECYDFMKYLAWLGGIIALLLIIEVSLGGGVIFSNFYAINQERAGLLRINIGTFLIVFSVIYSFIRYQYLPKFNPQRLWYLFLLVLGLFTLGFIIMTRAAILGLLVAFALWVGRKVTEKKIMFLCATVSLIAIFLLSGSSTGILLNTPAGKIVRQTTTELGSEKGNIAIRKNGVQYFIDLLWHNSPLTGIGLFSKTNYPNNPVDMIAEHCYYYIIDVNGITTVIYFGLQGVLLLTFFIVKSFGDTNMVLKHDTGFEKFNYEVLFFIFVYTLATPTLNNIIVVRMLVYSGVFFYLLFISKDSALGNRMEKIR